MPCPSTSSDAGGRKAGWPEGGNRVMGTGAGPLAWEHAAMSGGVWLSHRSPLLNVRTPGRSAAFEG